MIGSTDGGNTFAPAANPASGVTTLEASLPNVDGWPEFAPGASFRVITDPTVAAYGETVLVAWPDYRDGVSRIYFARSRDGGATWKTGATGKPLLKSTCPPNFQHFHPQIVVNPDGVFACSFYEFGPEADEHADRRHRRDIPRPRQIIPPPQGDRPTVGPALDAPRAHGDPKVTFIGDYFGFAGSERGFHPVWTDTRTGIQELWTRHPVRRAARGRR